MISERIKELRKSSGLTQIEFAQKLNVSYGTIAMWETGKRTPGIETIKKIADFFGVPPGSITGWEDNSNEEIDNEYYEIEEKLKFVGCKLGFYEEDAYLWIEFPDGSLEITEKDLSELNKSTNDFLKFKLMELRSERPKDFRKENK